MYVCMYVRMYVCICVCMYVCIYIYVNTIYIYKSIRNTVFGTSHIWDLGCHRNIRGFNGNIWDFEGL